MYGENKFGLGDPYKKNIAWEKVRQVDSWMDSIYRYEFQFGPKGDRKRHRWKKTKYGFLSDRQGMELYEKKVSGRGEILALYSQGLKFNPTGDSLFLQPGCE